MPMKLKALTYAYTVLCAASFLAIALPQWAAGADIDDPPGRVARLSYLQGSVSFQPAGEADWVMAPINRPMTTGDKLWVDADSRAELHIGSAAIRLNSNTGFSFLNLDDRTVQIQLSAGTLNIRVRRFGRDEDFEVDTPNQAFSLLRPGLYRIHASGDGSSTVVAVRDGEGEATGAGRTYTVESGQRATLTGTDSLYADIDRIGGRERDDFDDWCERRDHRDEQSRSMRYVSPEMVGYEDLDENGVWRHDSQYGDVWVPTAIPVGWAPYRYGHWAWISPWGWTWVDDASWGYAPFHYGRWVYARRAWCWVPGPIAEVPVYAPALVAFVGTPHFGVGIAVGGGAAVGWFPLGPREVYVPSYQVSREYVNRVNVSNTTVNNTTITNVYNTTVVNNVNSTQVTKINYVNRTAPGAVTAVPESTFRSAQPVATAAVAVNQHQVAAASVSARAEVAPTRNSVLGPSGANTHFAGPPAAVVDRPVVSKTAPPPPPVSFERQERALAAHPGQPLARSEVETLRPTNVPPAHPLVRQAPPGQPAMPSANHRAGQGAVVTPGQPNAEPANVPPSAQPNNRLSNIPSPEPRGNAPTDNAPSNMPTRNDRLPSAQPGYRPPSGNQPNGRPNYQPASEQPSHAQPNNRPSQPVNTAPTAPPSMPPRNDRPPSAQPDYRPSSGNQPSAQRNYQPTSGQPPYVQPTNRPGQPNVPATVPPSNRPSNSQPNYQPPSSGNRPNSGPPPNERPSNAQPPNTPSAQPNNRRSDEPSNAPGNHPGSVPPSEPRRNAAPNNPPPAPQPRNDRPLADNKGRAPDLPPANKGSNTPPHADKEKNKKD